MKAKISHGVVSCQITIPCPLVASLLFRAFCKCAYLFHAFLYIYIYGGIYGNLISLLCLQKNKRLLVINFTFSDWTQQCYKSSGAKSVREGVWVQHWVGRGVPGAGTGFSSSLKFWHHISHQLGMGEGGRGVWKPEGFQLAELDLLIPSDSLISKQGCRQFFTLFHQSISS